jgi:hypothetical protein
LLLQQPVQTLVSISKEEATQAAASVALAASAQEVIHSVLVVEAAVLCLSESVVMMHLWFQAAASEDPSEEQAVASVGVQAVVSNKDKPK